MAPRRKSPKSEKCGTIVINGRKRNLYKGDQGGVYTKDSMGKKTYLDSTVPRPKKGGTGAKRRKSPKRKSPRRKSPKRKSPKRKCSPRTRPSAYKCKTRGKLKQPYRDSSTGRCHYCYAEKK